MVRSMDKSDREAVLDILRATDMFTPTELASALEQIDIYLGRPQQKDYSLVVVENEEGRVAGYMSFGLTPLAEGVYDLYWMAVTPEEQGRGYGKELVRWLEGKVRAEKGRMLLIETSSQPKYHPTRQFYLNLGFREISRISDFYKPGDDRITYAKYFAMKEAKENG